MKISVQVKAGVKESKISEKDGLFFIYLKSQPHEGKANAELIRLLASHFRVSQGRISIKSGHTSRRKMVEIK